MIQAVPAIPLVLKAGSTGLILVFTYTADDDEDGPIDMNGGTVRLKIHPDWEIGIDNIASVSDGGTTICLYLRDRKVDRCHS